MKARPPRLAQRLFDWYCERAQVDDLRGDLDEWFDIHLQSQSVFTAKWIYWKQVISLMFSYAIRKRKANSRHSLYSSNSISLSMLQNYLKVAVRNLYQYRYFSILNAFGLAMGMSISLLLIAMYSYISTYDNFHQHRERIYAITSHFSEGTDQFYFASTPVVLGDQLREEFSGAEEVVRIQSTFGGDVKHERENIPVKGYYVDPNFFSVFTFEWISGNAQTALTKPHTIVLTEKAAQKIFGHTDVVGKSFELFNGGSFEVTGLLKDYPLNTHLEFEALASYQTLPASQASHEEQWTNYRNQYVYVLLDRHHHLTDLNQYLQQIEKKHYDNTSAKVAFEPVALEHVVTAEVMNSIGVQWETSGFIVFTILCIIILLPGIFNYTNLSIARALKRSKEIGLRKTMGGAKGQIFFQFITETIVITLIALLGAIGIFFVIRGEFQSMLVEASSLDLNMTVRMGLFFFVFALTVGFVAGVFPALHFSKLNPIQALKGQKGSGQRISAAGLRKGLSVFQFSLSFCFILCLVVFARMYHSLITFDFSFQKENIVNVDLQGVDGNLFKNEFSKLAPVQSVALSSGTLGLAYGSTQLHDASTNDSLKAFQLFADASYINLFKLKIIAGESFPEQSTSHEKFLLVNEEFIKSAQLGTAEQAIGKTYIVDGQELVIRGVLKNFHFAPPSVPIDNFVFRMNPDYFTQANLNVDVSNVYTAFTAMEKTWKIFSDHAPFKAMFFEDELNESYSSYRSIFKITGSLCLFALTISILGLLGMVVYTSEMRMKEVSIRKVMGATVPSLMMMLSKDYLKLIGWAIALGLPVTVLAFEHVFSRIPNYQADLTTGDVIISCFLLLGLGLFTVSSQTYKAASANPAITLKCE